MLSRGRFVALCLITCGVASPVAVAATWDCEVFPSERRTVFDATSGAELVFVTSATSSDMNLYFHERSWLPDGSAMAFFSDRTGAHESFCVLEKTGELVRLSPGGPQPSFSLTASKRRPLYYAVYEGVLHEWTLRIDYGEEGVASRVRIEDRTVGQLPADAGSIVGLNENCDGSGAVIGYRKTNPNHSAIVLMDTETGEVQTIASLEDKISHVQASWETPDLVLFRKHFPESASDRSISLPDGRVTQRMWLADLSDREPWKLYPQIEGELVTHECWWTEDRVVFCSGENWNGDAIEAHVKVVDARSGLARILGAGYWREGASPRELGKRNWWHCSGAPDGKFAAGDNWHGDIGLFDGTSSRTRILTSNHRVYGDGPHPHVGWDPTGTKVVFTSNRNGNPDVCVAKLPDDWLGGW